MVVRLDDKVALVTGSGQGIGAAIALYLGRQGAKVVINYAKSAESANDVVQAIKGLGSDAIAIQADVSKAPQMVRLFEEAVGHFGKLDIVCSKSGAVSFDHPKDQEEEFDQVFNIFTRGPFFLAQQAHKHLSVGGRIILITPKTADSVSVPQRAVYSASKAAIFAAVSVLSKEYSKNKITINIISLSDTDTVSITLLNAENPTKDDILNV
ncbi:Tetrahydroxynaphthalene reductase [Colletotrichum tanaceti]|uniref:Tetrahydroxynaphthalene reductase n=1 Tax=Colletotrichum tanaceti TaxID=1306861 RepID=A0A4V6DH47_9PEZI|nr:Tetrahydroxynaphthalene reductase [Colletotrichum tanaceti]TKW55296.1 Tetrahydroxynaphthalene reductase [Colletotrichum tanaceti]